MQAAVQALQQGRLNEAATLLWPLAERYPGSADVRHLLATVLRGGGDLIGAEREYRAAVTLDKRRPQFHADLGVLLIELGRIAEAERPLRAAIALDRRFAAAVVPLSELLCAQGRAVEAAQLTAPLAASATADEAVLSAHASALKACGRLEACLAAYERAVTVAPRSAIAEHNVAATLGDLGRHAEAEAAARRARAKGLDRAETWLVLGRALQGQDRFEAAEAALRQTLRRAPAYAAAHAELAQLIWMRTEDAPGAAAELSQAILGNPDDAALRLALAQFLDFAGDLPGAYRALEPLVGPGAPVEVNVAAARALLKSDPVRALRHAEDARASAGGMAADLAYCEALFACGRPAEASPVIEQLRHSQPLDQHVLAYQATLWRLQGDPRYGDLYDYENLVSPFRLDRPSGWTSLESYLADLRAALLDMHTLKAHPVGQSLRFGTQTTQALQRSTQPAIRAFFEAIDGPIRQYIAQIGRGKGPFRSRTRGGYVVAGSWSVRLRPGEGYHTDHVHQKGWISSACYIDLPAAVEGEGRQGWIKFGQPGTPTEPALEAEHYVKPETGMLVLFPSYMWHGTIPFGGDAPRLTVAFDLVPAG